MKFSFTIGGGLGDFVLKYLGFPGNRLSHILQLCPGEVQLRVSSKQVAGIDLFRGNPYFTSIEQFVEIDHSGGLLPNDISFIKDLESYNKITPPLWLDPHEEEVLNNLPKPYAAFHPTASDPQRCVPDQKIKGWIESATGLPVVTLGENNWSSRLSARVVGRAAFFVGSHSSMQCAAWVYNVPSLCMAPSLLLLHNWYAPNSFDKYLKPLFGKNVFMLFEQAEFFGEFFDHFLRTATSLTPRRTPAEYRRRLFP